MKIRLCLMVAVFLFIGNALYAANGDLIVNGNIGVGTTSPLGKLDARGTAIVENKIESKGFVDLAKGITPTITSGSGSFYSGGPTYRGLNSNWAINSFPSAITLDLIGAQTSQQIDYVSFGTSWRDATTYFPKDYSIDYSIDGINWSNIASVHNYTGKYATHYANSINARYVRLTVLAPQSGQSSAIIAGLQVLSHRGVTMYGDNPWATQNDNTFLALVGNVGIGTVDPGSYKLYVNGPFFASSGPWTSSDIRFKKNLLTLSDSLEKVLRLEGVSFEWKTDDYKEKGFPEGRHYGVIAQAVEKVIPDVVGTGPDGTKNVNYNEIIPVLIEAIKEQQKLIEQLNTAVKDLQHRDK